VRHYGSIYQLVSILLRVTFLKHYNIFSKEIEEAFQRRQANADCNSADIAQACEYEEPARLGYKEIPAQLARRALRGYRGILVRQVPQAQKALRSMAGIPHQT